MIVVDNNDVSSLSEAQDMALSLTPIFSGLLSALGSATIIHMVLTSKKKTSYRRILLGLSCSDLVSSLVLPLQAFLLPSDTSQRVWAVGNAASCSAMGFFLQLSLSTVWYNGMLSFYFLLTVKFGTRERHMASRYEPWMHLFSLGFPLVTASIGAGMGFYDELNVSHGCWVANYPKGCGCKDEGQEDRVCCVSPIIGWIYAGFPTTFFMIAILVNNLLVYCHVRTTLQRSRLYLKEYRDSVMSDGATRENPVRDSTRPSSASAGSGSQPEPDPHLARIRAVAVQGFLYVLVFFIIMFAPYTLRILEAYNALYAKDEAQFFPLLLLQSLVWPMQGLMNLMVYARPSYLRARKDFPNESRFWAFRRALHGAKIQPTDEPDPDPTNRDDTDY